MIIFKTRINVDVFVLFQITPICMALHGLLVILGIMLFIIETVNMQVSFTKTFLLRKSCLTFRLIIISSTAEIKKKS